MYTQPNWAAASRSFSPPTHGRTSTNPPPTRLRALAAAADEGEGISISGRNGGAAGGGAGGRRGVRRLEPLRPPPRRRRRRRLRLRLRLPVPAVAFLQVAGQVYHRNQNPPPALNPEYLQPHQEPAPFSLLSFEA